LTQIDCIAYRFRALEIGFAHNLAMKELGDPIDGPVDEPVGDPIGGAWLARHYGLELVMPLAVASRVAGRRATRAGRPTTAESYVEAMRPHATLRGHLTFHLKHEIAHFELLSRLFACCDVNELSAWVADAPTGRYARRAGFLYEFFSGQRLPVPPDLGGGYHDAISADGLVVATPNRALLNKRWRVRDNMPGTRAFCPMVVTARAGAQALEMDVRALIHGLEVEFGTELLLRSAVWMTLRESRASFEIEGEANKTDRIQRFADVLARRTGRGDNAPLDDASLAELQQQILGQRTTVQRFGLRQSPVFVGEVVRYQEIVHYVAPPPEDLADMLAGLQTFLDKTRGQSPVMRCAVAAFGFIYIHPLADGNGRVHRFLVNDVLRRDGVVQDPMILPVSSSITSNPAARRAYDRILDLVSRPLMRTLATTYRFTETATAYPDGIRSNFVFDGAVTARHAWRYLDLSAHVGYVADIVQRTIRDDMTQESHHLRRHGRARVAIKQILEMPDAQCDRVIRSVQNNRGELSGSLRQEMPMLAEHSVWDAVVLAVRTAFEIGAAPAQR
jgi:Fic/DOC family